MCEVTAKCIDNKMKQRHTKAIITIVSVLRNCVISPCNTAVCVNALPENVTNAAAPKTKIATKTPAQTVIL